MRNNVISKSGEQSTIADRTYEQLKNAIVSGVLAQGSKIVEEDLARQYGISRGPLREAIHRLKGSNLIVSIPHAGSRVVTLTQQMMLEIYEVRESLEGMSARLAAEKITEPQISDLWKLLNEHEQAIAQTDGKNYFQNEGNFDFHFRIAEASGNQWLLDHLYIELYQLVRMCRQQSAQTPERPAKALNEHRQILEAISQHDAELAEILMRRHISGSWKIVKQLLPKENHE
ncbi:MAG: GntR family transcriptional regulator [Gammaproteobacteria bacterium]|nr:GntR family transcriptional regulator [Gammaproteobacteria bacterium]